MELEAIEHMRRKVHRFDVFEVNPVFKDVCNSEIRAHMWAGVPVRMALPAEIDMSGLAHCNTSPMFLAWNGYCLNDDSFCKRIEASLSYPHVSQSSVKTGEVVFEGGDDASLLRLWRDWHSNLLKLPSIDIWYSDPVSSNLYLCPIAWRFEK
jgi:hypothetical protein